MNNLGNFSDINETFIIETILSGASFDVFVTGGTYANGIATFTNNSGDTFTVTGFSTSGGSGTDVFVTGGTYVGGTATFTNNTGGTFTVTGFSTSGGSGTDVFVTGGTYDNSIGTATFTNNTGGTFSVSGFITSGSTSNVDVFVTGGTYDNLTGVATYTNNTGGTFTVTGFLTGATGTDIYVTGTSYNQLTSTLTLRRNDGVIITTNGWVYITGSSQNNNVLTLTNNSGNTTTYTPNAATGGTYSNGTISLLGSGTLSNITGLFTGGTEVYVTGGTYSSGTATFTNNTGGTFSVSGFSTGITNFDVFVTGGTYSNGTATFRNNTGGTFTVSGLYTGATEVFVTGGTYSNGSTTFTNSTGGTFTVSGYYTGTTDNDVFVTGSTQNNNLLTLTTNSGTTFTYTPNAATGGTYSNGIISLLGSGTLSNITGFFTGSTEVYVTGGTYNPSTGVATFTNNTGGTFTVVGFNSSSGTTDTYVTGGTPNNSAKTYTFTNNVGSTFTVVGLTDLIITAGTYSNGSTTFTNNTGGTFTVSGYFTGTTDNDVFVTGSTQNNNLLTLTTNSGTTFTYTPNAATGGTYSNGTITLGGSGTLSTITGFFTGSTEVFVTGGTPNNSALTYLFTNNTGGTFTVTGLTDVRVTGGTYNNPTGTATFTNSTGGTFTVTGFMTGTTTDTYVTGGTANNSSKLYTFTNNSGGTFTVTALTDLTITAGTTNNSSKLYTFTNSTGGTFSVTGLTDLTITAGTYNNSTGTATFTNSTGGTFTVAQWNYVTGSTQGNNVLTLGNNSGGTTTYTPNAATGGTYSNGTISLLGSGTLSSITGLSVLSADTYVTGGTPNNSSLNYLFTNNTGGTFTVAGLTDVRVTGGTYSTGTATFTNNTGGTFTVTGLYTGATDVYVTGGTYSNGTVTYRNSTGGTFTVTGFTNVENVITVGKSGDVMFNTITAAVNSITGSSDTNRYVVKVGAGVYTEPEINLCGKTYVSIVGSAIQTTVVKPNTATQNIFNLGAYNELSFLWVEGAGLGYAGIAIPDSGNYSQAHKVTFNNCDTGISISSSTQDTYFYGEYLDYNGIYSYGTKIIATNGFVAFANMENYYNILTSTANTVGNYIIGVGAKMDVITCGNEGKGYGTAFHIEDGASLALAATYVDNFDVGLHIASGGTAPFVKIPVFGSSCVTNDLIINHTGATGAIHGVMNAAKISYTGSGVSIVYQDPIASDFTINGRLNLRFSSGTITDISTAIVEGTTTGLMSGGQLTPNTGFTVSVGGGFGYVEDTLYLDELKEVIWTATTKAFSASTENYLYYTYDGVLSTSTSRPDVFANVLLGRVVTHATGVNFIDGSPLQADHIGDRLSIFNRDGIGAIYSSGSNVSENTGTSFTLNVTSGVYFFGENSFAPTGDTIINMLEYYRNGSGGFNSSASTFVDNTRYDNNSGTLVPLSGGYYTKHSLYVIDGIAEKYFLVYGQSQYSALTLVEQANISSAPTFLRDSVVLIAGIIVKQGAANITEIMDLRPVIGFKAPSIAASSYHSNLLGLLADDHPQYLLVDGTRAMSGNLNLGTHNIFNAGAVSATTFYGDGSALKNIRDTYVTDGTANNSSKLYTFTNNSGGTFNVTALTDLTITAGTGNDSSKFYTFTNSTGGTFNVTALTDVRVTGGTYNNPTGTATFTNNTGGTFTVAGFVTGTTTDTYVTGGTTNNSSKLYTFTNNSGGTFSLTGLTDIYLTAGTANNSSKFYTFTNSTGGTFNVTGLTDLTITGGTYSNATGTATFTNSTGGTFTVAQWNYVTGSSQSNNVLTLGNNSGGTTTYTPNAATGGTYSNGTITLAGSGTLSTITGLSVLSADTYVTGGTPNNSGKTYLFTNNTGGTFSVTGLTDIAVTGGTYNNPTGTATFTNSTGGTFTVAQWNYVTGSSQSNNVLTLTNNSGGTTTYTPNAATGGTYSNGTISLLGSGSLSNITGIPNVFVTGGTPNNSALTYLFTNNTGGTFTVNGLTDVRVTGGTYSSGTATFTNNTGGTFNVTGFSTGGGTGDTFVTGGTYSNGTATYRNNTGGTFTVTGFTSSPALSGTPTAPTAITGDNSSIIATTAFVQQELSASTVYFSSAFTGTGSVASPIDIIFPVSALTTTGTSGPSTLVNHVLNIPQYSGGSSGFDVFVTGGTYATGTATFRNNTGGTFSVTGFSTGTTDTDIHITGASQSNNNLVFTNSTGGTTTYTPNAATGGTYSNGTISLLGSGTLSNITGLPTSAATIYTADGQILTNRTVDIDAKTLAFSSSTFPNALVISGYSNFINTNIVNTVAPAALTISGINTTSYNLISASGNVNNYLQFNIQNKNSGLSGSSDIVATNDTGTETNNYIDMGINSSTHSSVINSLGVANDAYLYSTGRELLIGNASTGATSNIRFFGGGFNGSTGVTEMFISGAGGTVGFSVMKPTHPVHISGATDPIRVEGVQSGSDTLLLTVDANGVVHTASNTVITGTVGTNTQITFNNAGTMSGSPYITWTPQNNTLAMTGLNTTIVLSAITTEPSAPPSGLMKIYSRSIAGKMVIKTVGPSGLDTSLQNALWGNNTVLFTAGAAAGLWIGTVGANLGTPTLFVPVLSGTNSVAAAMRTSRFPTVVTTANQQVGTRTEAMYYRSNNSSVGGFFFTTRFNIISWTAGDRLFVGFSTGTTTVVTVNPSGLTNTCGFGVDANDTGFTFMTAASAGTATKAAIVGQPVLAVGNAYAAYIFCRPNDTVVYYRLDNLSNGTTLVDTSTSTTLPLNTVPLVAHVAMGNAANVAAGNAVIGINRIYIETDI